MAAVGLSSLISWVGIDVIGDIDLVVGSGEHADTIGAARITASAMATALLGWAVLAVIERRFGAGRRTLHLWRLISIGALAVSLAGPLTADAPASTRWWLVALHTSVAAVYIPMMGRRPAA